MNVYSVVQGLAKNLDNVSDPVFSKRMLGDGVAVEPSNSRIFSPVDGKIIMFFETMIKHGLNFSFFFNVLRTKTSKFLHKTRK